MEITAKDIHQTINKIRENPNLALNQIKQQLKKFESNSVYRNKRDLKIRTLSGKAGWQQAILAIERQKPKGNLNWNRLLETAVEEYKVVAGEDEGVNPFQVIKKMCSYQGNISFNINQSDLEQDLVEIVAAMIVGDGDEKKGSRTAIFHPLYRQFACAIRKSGSKMIIYTVFAQSVTEPVGNPSPAKKQSTKSQSESRSSWQQPMTAKFNSPIISSEPKQSVSSKYKQQEQAPTKQSYIKKGKQLIAELNKIRKQPKQYIHALKSQIQKFKDDKTISTDYGIITTKQGQAPYYDLISELETLYPLPTMREVTGLTLVGVQQILESYSMIQGKMRVEDIIDKFCTASDGIRSIKLRDIQGMPISAMLMRLLVGDGDRKRTARKKMLSPICKAIGCAISKDILVVNVGQTAKDNAAAVQQYIQNLEQPSTPKKSHQSSKHPQQDPQYFDKISSSSYPSSSSKNRSQPIGEGDRIVIKKTSKSHNESKAGRVYRITEIQTIYNDGQIQKIVEEELLG